jgi:hypothetical protein
VRKLQGRRFALKGLRVETRRIVDDTELALRCDYLGKIQVMRIRRRKTGDICNLRKPIPFSCCENDFE